jgi:hypothetical protein
MTLALALFLLVCGLAALVLAGESLARGPAVIIVTLLLLVVGFICSASFLRGSDPVHAALGRLAYGGAAFTALAVTAVLLRSTRA